MSQATEYCVSRQFGTEPAISESVPTSMGNTTMPPPTIQADGSLPQNSSSGVLSSVTSSSSFVYFKSHPLVREFFEQRRRRLEKFITSKETELLSPWVPEKSDSKCWEDGVLIEEFIRKLNVPSLRGEPNMLLHGVGTGFWPTKAKKILCMEHDAADICFINSTGAGKTRTLLNLLCVVWGLYFISQQDSKSTSIGSSDLLTCIKETFTQKNGFTQNLPEGPKENYSEQLMLNRDLAYRGFSLVLLERLLILEEFLTIAQEKSLQFYTQQKRWMLLQVCPHLLDISRLPSEVPEPDIFQGLVSILHQADPFSKPMMDIESVLADDVASTAHIIHRVDIPTSYENLLVNIDQTAISTNRRLFKQLSGITPKICVVVDEVQTLAKMFPNAFCASNDVTRRPVMRELIWVWTQSSKLQSRFILSGTAISSALVTEPLSSFLAKPCQVHRLCELGSFDRRKRKVSAYMKAYIPKHLLERMEWKHLLHRCDYWLSGRYRFTSAFVQLLIRFGYQNPHLLLNTYIYAFTNGFTPSDSSDIPGISQDHLQYFRNAIEGPNFETIADDSAKHLNAMVSVSYERFIRFNTNPQPISTIPRVGSFQAEWVEIGLAQYGKSEEDVLYDEPLAHLAFNEWIRTQRRFPEQTLWEFTSNRIYDHSHVLGNGYEKVLVTYLAHIFSDWYRMDEVFNFLDLDSKTPREIRKLASSRARLVTYYQDHNGEMSFAPVKIPINGRAQSPSHVLGFEAKSADEVIKWFTHDQVTCSAPFCFPTELMGPDILFFLQIEHRSKTKSIVCVALQAKIREIIKPSENTGPLANSLAMMFYNTVTPLNFYTSKYRGRTPTGRLCREALTNLKHGINETWIPHNVVRVLAIYPKGISESFSIKNYSLTRPTRPAHIIADTEESYNALDAVDDEMHIGFDYEEDADSDAYTDPESQDEETEFDTPNAAQSYAGDADDSSVTRDDSTDLEDEAECEKPTTQRSVLSFETNVPGDAPEKHKETDAEATARRNFHWDNYAFQCKAAVNPSATLNRFRFATETKTFDPQEFIGDILIASHPKAKRPRVMSALDMERSEPPSKRHKSALINENFTAKAQSNQNISDASDTSSQLVAVNTRSRKRKSSKKAPGTRTSTSSASRRPESSTASGTSTSNQPGQRNTRGK